MDEIKQLSEAQRAFIALEKKKAEYKAFLDELATATKAVVSEIGTDSYFQDEEGTVYKTFNQEGKFVYFEPVAIKRTRRADEPSSGTNLSIKEAEAAGFILPKK